MPESIKTTHHGGCPHDCPDICAMVFEVENGELTGIKGNPDHPMTRRILCVKLQDHEKRHYYSCPAIISDAPQQPKVANGSSAHQLG